MHWEAGIAPLVEPSVSPADVALAADHDADLEAGIGAGLAASGSHTFDSLAALAPSLEPLESWYRMAVDHDADLEAEVGAGLVASSSHTSDSLAAWATSLESLESLESWYGILRYLVVPHRVLSHSLQWVPQPLSGAEAPLWKVSYL